MPSQQKLLRLLSSSPTLPSFTRRGLGNACLRVHPYGSSLLESKSSARPTLHVPTFIHFAGVPCKSFHSTTYLDESKQKENAYDHQKHSIQNNDSGVTGNGHESDVNVHTEKDSISQDPPKHVHENVGSNMPSEDNVTFKSAEELKHEDELARKMLEEREEMEKLLKQTIFRGIRAIFVAVAALSIFLYVSKHKAKESKVARYLEEKRKNKENQDGDARGDEVGNDEKDSDAKRVEKAKNKMLELINEMKSVGYSAEQIGEQEEEEEEGSGNDKAGKSQQK